LTGSPVLFTTVGIAIASYAETKLYLGIKDTDTVNDELFSAWLGEVSVEIESRLRQPVMPRVFEEFTNGGGGSKIYLNSRIVSLFTDVGIDAIDSLQSRNSVADAWENIVDDENLIFLNPCDAFAVILLDFNYFPQGMRNIRCKYYGGFNPIPGDIHEMSQQMVQIMWENSKKSSNPRLGMQSRNRGAGGFPAGDTFRDMDADWKKVINRWKKLL
jgi:hypothetical protein